MMRGSAFAGCDMRELHTVLARDGRAEAVTLDGDGAAVAANEFLYKKSVVIVPLARDSHDNLSPEAIAACLETLRREVAGNPEVKDVIDVRLTVVDSNAPLPVMGEGAAMLTQHRQLYRATAFVRRYTQAPLRFAVPLPALIRIFDVVRYQHLEGRCSRVSHGSSAPTYVYWPIHALARSCFPCSKLSWGADGRLTAAGNG
ncbi:hypothetical protein AJ88_11820 [Mesorhizobium amorphae CCBAU 01583]|nr:hypothetical protein AJ88_11820 [Mesorhizobium amorphae CCBAU 01583]